MTQTARRRTAELSLIGIAAVWGLTFPAWSGALLIMAAIVAVEIAPRLRPPRPLPEG